MKKNCVIYRDERLAFARLPHRTRESTVKISYPLLIAALFLVGAALSAEPGRAGDLTGAWATDATKCKNIFRQDGNQISFREDSDAYGSGFVVEGNRIKGKIAQCSIKSRREDGATLHLITSCSTDIMLSNNQFSLKFIDDNTVARIFPGDSALQESYYRCAP